MNKRLRNAGLVMLLLFLILFVNLNYLQVFHASDLYANQFNSRFIIEQNARPRGDLISSDNVILATSQKTDDILQQRRVYPTGPLLAHPVGFLSPQFGAVGLEASQSARLLGDAGDGRLDRPDNLIDYLLGDSLSGTVRTTFDTRIQDTARKALGDQIGAVAAINPKTGAVYALWSNPSYDPNPVASHDATEAQTAFTATNQGDKPGLPRAYQETYPPGSSFKVVTAAAALKAGVKPDTAFPNPTVLDLPDSTVGLRNFGGETCRADAPGGVTFRQGLIESCNVTFGEIGLQLGDEKLRSQAELFGFNRPPPVDGLLTEPSVFPGHEAYVNSQSSLAQSAIGQFDVRVTPLQMAMVAGAVANKGVVMTPFVVEEVLDGKGRRIEKATPAPYSQAMSPEDADTLKSFMVGVVQQGTGTAGRIPGVSVGGKTGTAQSAEGANPHAWFIAFAPAEDPVVAVAVVVEHGGSLGSEATGGQVAAPVAKDVMEAVLNLKPDPGG